MGDVPFVKGERMEQKEERQIRSTRSRDRGSDGGREREGEDSGSKNNGKKKITWLGTQVRILAWIGDFQAGEVCRGELKRTVNSTRVGSWWVRCGLLPGPRSNRLILSRSCRVLRLSQPVPPEHHVPR